jgi:hypothetical protein
LLIREGIWGIYNCVRYLYSYSKFSSSQGQAAALALAISSSLSLAFLGCATLLSAFKAPLSRNVPPRASHVIRKMLRPISTGLILAPAILNVIFLCVWRNSDILELSYRFRCYIDIDVIWSITGRQCVAPTWGIWLILAVIRLVVTLVVIVGFAPAMHSAFVDDKFRSHIISFPMLMVVRSDYPTQGDEHWVFTRRQNHLLALLTF